MVYRTLSTIILTLTALTSLAAASETETVPQTALPSVNDTLLLLKNMRGPVHKQPSTDSALLFNPFFYGSPEIFRSDGASASEILKYKSLAVAVPFTLSSGMNRLLVWGNSAPLTVPSSPSLLTSCYSRYGSSDYLFSTQGSSFTFGPEASLHYQPYPHALAVPEMLIYWENGVFNQNSFNLRFSRPLSQNLMLNAFSNYRYFTGKRFNHERGGTMDFYKFFTSDTSLLMNRGYNPLVDELSMGGALLWENDDESKWRAGFSYGSLSNEYALDIKAEEPDRLYWALLDRGIYRTEASLLDKKIGPLVTGFKAAVTSETHESSFPPDTTIFTGKGHTTNFQAGADIAMPAGEFSRLAFTIESVVKNREFFDGAEKNFVEYAPEFVYTLTLPHAVVNTEIRVSAGAVMLTCEDTALANPKAKAAASFSTDNASLTLFAKTDAIAVYPDFEQMLYRPYTDGYVMIGGHGFVQAPYGGLLLGYQLMEGIDPFTVDMAWPMGKAPYPQPRHTFLIAPGTSRVKGFSLQSKAFISDSRPYLKASANMSYVLQPKGMTHFFEALLGMDYWSRRDPVDFAGHRGWNVPIYDLNLKLSAHIRSFRLFYKADNLLNLRHAYVPGYFSPGLTFRWGVNWFIQR
ncbi:MAG: hypothetical protein LBI42_09845 [Chitinispirillales bacterium]|jgi:hypothetical protein|nr:hypothetical protein [Chitinispirillales bacterium]